jgi:uncharacterized protein (TIGR03435 family)
MHNCIRVVVFAIASFAWAQGQPAKFEVVSIHEIVDGVRNMGDVKLTGNRAEYLDFGVQSLAAEAWNVRGDQIVLGPDVDPKTVYPMMAPGRSAFIYNIAALAPEGTTPTRDEFRLMVQSMLATPFKLVTHTEKREKDVYVLSVNGTPKLKPSTGEGTCRVTASRTPEGQRQEAKYCPVRTLIGSLFVDRTVYDETGLTGFYDFESTSALPFQANDPQAITPFTAVKELGLKLEPKRIPVETIVIDHVESPGEN